MSAQIFYNNGSSSSEVITHLINASDGAGLHFNGTSGNISFTPTDLGTKLSFEFIVQADSWGSSSDFLVDFGNGGRFNIGGHSDTSYNLGILSVSGARQSFGVKVLDDLKVHHLVITIDGTAAILYDNGNQVGIATINSPNIDNCARARFGSHNDGTGAEFFNGTFYRARFFNRVLSSEDVTSVYESASIDYADQWGSQTSLVDAAASVFTSGVYNWAKYGNNTIANVSNTLAITYVGGSMAEYGAYNMLADSSDLTTNLVVGKKYRVTFDAKYTGGSAGPLPQVYNGSAYTNGIALTTSLVTQSIEFTAEHATNGFIRLSGMSAGNVVTIDNWYVRVIGVSADFDLAYANPTQSAIVQNRSGSGDGTAAGGVTQISPIEQLNSKALRVGTSAATVADGDLRVSGFVGVNCDPDGIGLRLEKELNGQWAGLIKNTHTTNGSGLKVQAGDDADVTAFRVADVANNKLLEILGSGYVGVGGTPVGKMSIIGGTATAESSHITFENTAGAKVFAIGGGKSQVTNNDFCVINVTDNKTPLTISDAGNVGIGVSPTYAFEVVTGANSAVFEYANHTTGTQTIKFEPSSTKAGGTSKIYSSFAGTGSSVGKLALGVYGATDALTINSAGLASFSAGIAFSGQTDATGTGITSGGSNLNHYEEGTWTPTLLFGGATSGQASTNVGRYTRVGGVVTVTGRVALTAKGSSTGPLSIGGLPFPSANVTNQWAAASLRFQGVSFADFLQAYNYPNETLIHPQEVSNAGVTSDLTDANFTDTSQVVISLVYQV